MKTGKVFLESDQIEFESNGIKIVNSDGYLQFFDGYYNSGTKINVNKVKSSANWWDGYTCSEWNLTKSQIEYCIAQGGGKPVVTSYVHGATAVNNAYIGGVLTTNNKIYFVPYTQSSQSNWHYIDTNSDTVFAYSHGVSAVGNAYWGGVLVSNSRIYLVPFSQSNQSTWHYINTNNNSVQSYSHGLGSDTPVAQAYIGGVLAPNGKIYLIPFKQGNQSKWHYIDSNTGSVTAYSHNLGANTPITNAYVGGVLAPNGNIYLIPYGQANQSNWHFINTNNDSVQIYQHTGVSALSGAYEGGVLTPNGKIYLVPSTQSNQTYWHYINTETNTVTAYQHNSSSVLNAYTGGVLSPDNKIYLVPNKQANQNNWHYIDVNTNSVISYTHNISAVSSAYYSGIINHNGKIYLIPNSQATQTKWHYIDTNCNQPFNKNICTNPMFNKL